MKNSRSSGVGRGQFWYTLNWRAVRGFPSSRHTAIRHWNAVSKGGTSCCNSSSVTLVKSRNSVGRDCRSANHGVEGRRPCCLSTVDFRPALPAPDKYLSAHPAVQFRLLSAFSHSPFPLVSGSILLPV